MVSQGDGNCLARANLSAVKNTLGEDPPHLTWGTWRLGEGGEGVLAGSAAQGC